ncbi:MAG TPA: hypothetical protein VEI97_01420, partial [bacterium]|nr:hypothetical protein [bacterium]
GGHLTMFDYETGKPMFRGQTQDGHFIISDVKAGEYVLRFMDMRAIPVGGGMYIKVQPGRPVTDLKFEVWDVVPPPKNKDGTERISYEDFKKKFDLRDRADRDKGTN